jgi:hypothetical protein
LGKGGKGDSPLGDYVAWRCFAIATVALLALLGGCILRGRKIADDVRELLDRYFPKAPESRRAPPRLSTDRLRTLATLSRPRRTVHIAGFGLW